MCVCIGNHGKGRDWELLRPFPSLFFVVAPLLGFCFHVHFHRRRVEAAKLNRKEMCCFSRTSSPHLETSRSPQFIELTSVFVSLWSAFLPPRVSPHCHNTKVRAICPNIWRTARSLHPAARAATLFFGGPCGVLSVSKIALHLHSMGGHAVFCSCQAGRLSFPWWWGYVFGISFACD